jgi:hypothetical protein
LKAEVDDAFAKAKATNTPAAYNNFLNTYAKHGIDINEARDAYANADAQENAVRTAYRGALSTRSRDGYQNFLTQYGRTLYAADVRQRLAACRMQTQTTGGTTQSQMERSATGSGNTSLIACQEARNTVQNEIQSACLASHGRISGARIVSQNAQDASSAGGRVVGSLLGGALFGQNRNVNIGSTYRCSIEAAAVCEKAVSSTRQVETCP